jgi:hypothetical protein
MYYQLASLVNTKLFNFGTFEIWKNLHERVSFSMMIIFLLFGHHNGIDLLLNGFLILSILEPNLLCHITLRSYLIFMLMFIITCWLPLLLKGSK